MNSPEEKDEDFKYPTYLQAGGDKKWDDMTDLEQANYNLCKALNALAVTRTSNKRLRSHKNELLQALEEVVKISDRNHIAWDKAKAAIKKATE